ncbi:MAG: CRTAC1 family protein, partial [Planctomycetia bacterium]|nr:CRTAC1 family protein [Planctomycetia bacterium]
VSSQAGLKEPTVPMLGFGTQFLDADLDGWPDLVMANGHVDDFQESGVPYRMRGQYFSNRGNGRFVELSPEQLGDYFRREQLGRGMARLDWNRDGREDFAVSNLDTPASLVTNQTRDAGHFLALQLRGVASSRDAIGTTVVVRVADRRLVRQLTAGDGFQACNQRQLVFGLAESEVVDEIEIRWPAGLRQKFEKVPADSEYIFVEGRTDPVRLPAAPRW